MIQVLQQGLLDTIQDAGRYGYQHLGINPGGVMDRVGMYIANSLVDNELTEAVIEMHFPASAFLFENSALIALSGGDFGATVNGTPVSINKPILVSPQTVLRFTRRIAGARCYLAIRGGLALEPWLNSYSTHLKAGAGGFLGRQLLKNDHLPVNQPGVSGKYEAFLKDPDRSGELPWQADVREFYTTGVRLVPGSEFDLLKDPDTLTGPGFLLTLQSDRMGFRLKGPALKAAHYQEKLSAGVGRGTIQLLPDGQLIILMADHQTTGGYPRIAHVISADLPVLAQLCPHEPVRFSMVTHETAVALLREQEQALLFLQNACKLRWQEWLQH
jgi:antagonist of KipI